MISEELFIMAVWVWAWFGSGRVIVGSGGDSGDSGYLNGDVDGEANRSLSANGEGGGDKDIGEWVSASWFVVAGLGVNGGIVSEVCVNS